MLQKQMIARVKNLCQADPAIQAAMMYGSFALGNGDDYSDIEFILFFENDKLDTLDHREWLQQIAPVAQLYTNHYGIDAVIFENLVRGEFHFERTTALDDIASGWQGQVWFPSLAATLISDKKKRLTPYLERLIGAPLRHGQDQDERDNLGAEFINSYLFGLNVLQRGEHARALEMLWFVQRTLLLLARSAAGCTTRWHIPSRRLEADLSPVDYATYAACSSSLAPEALSRAYRNAWAWGKTLLEKLNISRSGLLIEKISARVTTFTQ